MNRRTKNEEQENNIWGGNGKLMKSKKTKKKMKTNYEIEKIQEEYEEEQ